MQWLYIHLPNLPIDIQERSSPANIPLVIISARGQDVLFCNQAARESGIRPGMALNTATVLAPDLQHAIYQEHAIQAALQGLAQWAYGYIAQIAIYPPDGLLLEVQSMLRLHQTLPRLWTTLSNGLEAQGFQAQLALADTPQTARALAKTGMGHMHDTPQQIHSNILNTSPGDLLRHSSPPEWRVGPGP